MSEEVSQPTGANVDAAQAQETYTKEQLNSAAAAARRDADKALKEATDRLNVLEAQEEERKTAAMSELEKAQSERDEYKTKFDEVTETAKNLQEAQDKRDEDEKAKVDSNMEGLEDVQKDLINQLPLYSRMNAISQFKTIKGSGVSAPGKGAPNTSGIMSTESILELKATDPVLAAKKYRERKAAGY